MNLSAIACLISLHGSGEAALAATPNSTGRVSLDLVKLTGKDA